MPQDTCHMPHTFALRSGRKAGRSDLALSASSLLFEKVRETVISDLEFISECESMPFTKMMQRGVSCEIHAS